MPPQIPPPPPPGETISADYVTEYSTDRIEMHAGAVLPGQRVLLIDDLIATGGTLGGRGGAGLPLVAADAVRATAERESSSCLFGAGAGTVQWREAVGSASSGARNGAGRDDGGPHAM